MPDIPENIIVLGKDGLPSGLLDVEQLRADAEHLMYEMAAASGDEAALARVADRWSAQHPGDYLIHVRSCALSLMTRMVVAHHLEQLDEADPGFDHRGWLRAFAGGSKIRASALRNQRGGGQ